MDSPQPHVDARPVVSSSHFKPPNAETQETLTCFSLQRALVQGHLKVPPPTSHLFPAYWNRSLHPVHGWSSHCRLMNLLRP